MKLPSLRRKAAETPSTSAASTSTSTPRRRRPSKKRWWIFAALMLAVVGYSTYRARTREAPHAEVTTARVERANVRELVSATGTIQPFTTVDVKSKAGGKVLQMAVEEGTLVKQGQLICVIDRQDTTTAYREAQADLEAARSALQQARENARLQKASLGPQIQQSAEALNSARARLKQANETLGLEAKTSQAQVEQSAAAVAAARAGLEQARQSLELQKRTTQNAIEDAQSGINAARARYEQATTQAASQPELSQAAITQAEAGVAAAQAGLNSAQESLRLLREATQPQETATVRATVDGAKSQLDVAQLNLTRQEALLAKGYVARSVVDEARNQVVTARTSLQTSQARLDTLEAGQEASVRDQQARIEQAKSTLAQARATLQSARLNTVQDTLAEKDVDSARAALAQARTGLQTAQANSRQIALRESEVKSAQAALQQSEATLRSARAGTRQVNVRAADVEAARAAVRQADAALSGSEANVIQSSVRAEDVTQAQARLVRAEVTVKNARDNLDQTIVKAPRDGIILQKYVDVGTIIQSGQSGISGGTSIVQLANVSRLYVDVKVDEADISKVQPGQVVMITLDAYPDAPIGGAVRKIYPLAVAEANVTSIHVQVEVNAKDVRGNLRPNMNATCDFIVNDKPDTLSVPPEAVRDKGEKTVVTVIKDPSKPLWDKANQIEREVQVGVRGDERTEIVSGLKTGETIVAKTTEPGTPPASGGFGGRGR